MIRKWNFVFVCWMWLKSEKFEWNEHRYREWIKNKGILFKHTSVTFAIKYIYSTCGTAKNKKKMENQA